LIALGHSNIAFIRGEDDLDSSGVRYTGYADAMHLAGLSVSDDLIATAGFSYASGAREAARILERATPTAIMAGGDLIALGAMDAARARGLSVPGDISIIGFDDLPRAAQSYPPLSTVRQPLHDMGRAGARSLLSITDGQKPIVDRVRLPTAFIDRGTTAPPRVNGA
jgi:LacI family transcriptional regulator